LTPVHVAALTSVATLGIGDGGCAIDVNGQPFCWGQNESGQVGDGTRDDRLIPTNVLPP
jgi:hypothetical protein